MEFYASSDSIAALERSLADTGGAPRPSALLTLAWYLRQRDCARALELLQQAEVQLARPEIPEAERRRGMARSQLVQAEIRLLSGELARARELARSAAAVFEELDDPLGTGDTHWLEASIWVDLGNSSRVDHAIDQAIEAYLRAGDTQRIDAARARRLVHAAFREPGPTATTLDRDYPEGVTRPAVVACWVATARANVAGLTDDPGRSIRYDLEAYQAALDSAQVRQALVSVTNAAESFAMLGALDASLEWSERGLALARSTGWPASTGFCLMQLGDVLRLLGRHEEARNCLQESLTLMATQSGSRNYAQGLANLAQLLLDEGDHAGALAAFEQLEQHLEGHLEPDLLVRAWRGQANALARLDRPQEAGSRAGAALALAREQGNAEGQIQALCALAQIHLDHQLPPPAGMTAASPALHYLDEARAIAAGISGYAVSPELLQQLAMAQAACGDHRMAFDNLLAAEAARGRRRSVEAQQRALAMQVRHEVERARSDSEHHRRLTETLQETAATLETLGKVGREITASLDTGAVFEALNRHVHELLDAPTFMVCLINNASGLLEPVFCMEEGRPIEVADIPLDSPTSMFARCVRERREIVIDHAPGTLAPNFIPGTVPTLSLMYAPLMIGERVLGAMTIQSPASCAYGEREQSIFVTLCAYGAIALDNAAAYGAAEASQRRADQALGELRIAQQQLVEDIAARKLVERELQQLNNELEARIAERTREIGATVAMLAESKQKLQAIVDTALDAVVRVDSRGVIIGWNVQAEALFGMSSQEAIGRTLHETIVPPEYREAHLHGMARYMETQESRVVDRRIEISGLHRAGHVFPIELAITRVSLEDPSKFEFCAFIRDITQRRQAEEEIRTSLEKQKELNQLKTRFVAMASHQFRTPLATIMSSVELLQLYYERLTAEQRTELFESVGVAVRRMTGMLEDVLLIGKSESDRAEFAPAPLALRSLCREIVDELPDERDREGESARVRLRVEGGSDQGFFDEKLLRHIFGNLLSNALKYSPQGGEVEFSVDCGAEAFRFTVRDRGIGIPADDLPRLFESFHRAANVGNIGGTGLGLAIVKRSVELHSGTIDVRSTLGEGTTFVVTLPRVEAA